MKQWQREALQLKDEGLSSRKIAAILGVGKSSVNDFFVKYFADSPTPDKRLSHDTVRVETSRRHENKNGTTHIVIPDTQCKEGVDFKFLRNIGEYIADKQPDVIIHLGDHADMPSLSSYDKGKKSSEGRRVYKDIEAAIAGMNALLEPIRQVQKKEKDYYGEVLWKPRMVLTLGNHEERILRHVNANPELDGFLSLESLKYEDMGWEVCEFLKPIVVDGIAYCHYFANPFTGKPYTGSATNILKTVGESFTQGHKQTLDVATRFLPSSGKQQWGLIAGACLEENHKVLTADLRYVRLGDLQVGDELVSFEEEVTSKRSRRFQKGKVLALRKVEKEVKKVTLESGKIFYATPDHRWFVRTGSTYRWVYTTNLRKGTCLPRLLPEWQIQTHFLDGWLAGIYDGEGSLYQRETTDGNFCLQLAVSQRPGPVFNKIKEVLNERLGCETTEHINKRGVGSFRIKGGVRGILKVLGSIRPLRLLPKFDPDKMGRINCTQSDQDKIVSIEDAGIRTIVEIDIDKKTMIVEGYGHHNCYEHSEDYKGPQGNHHWRGIVVKHNVVDGSYDPMFVSLEYLNQRFN